MTESRRDYDREWTVPVGNTAWRRVGITSDRGNVVRFVVQLEYEVEGERLPVVRYDHDAEGSDEATHDVSEEGLHMDIYREGDKYRTKSITGPLPASIALDLAEDHLSKNLERFIRRFEQWHEISSQ